MSVANGEQSPVVNVRKTEAIREEEGRLKSKLHPCWKRAREIPSVAHNFLMMEEATQRSYNYFLRLLLVQGSGRGPEEGTGLLMRWVAWAASTWPDPAAPSAGPALAPATVS